MAISISDTTHSRRLKNICDDYGLNFLVKSPTRMTENSSTLIDLCVSDISMNRIECNVSTEEQIFDHGLLFITINGRCDKSVDKKRKIQVWANYNENDLWQSIENSLDSWAEVEFSDVNTKMNWFIKTLEAATDKFKKVKTISTKHDFFDRELESMRQEKNRLYKIAQLSPNNTESATNWHLYRVFKNDYKKAIQTKRFEFNQRKLNRAHGDSKATWKVLNSILNRETNEITRITYNDVNIENDLEITNTFNNYFINSVMEINQNIPIIQFEDDMHINHES